MKLERNQNFHSIANEKIKCPVPGCLHTGEVITKIHCREYHGMEREEVREKYGTPYRIIAKHAIYSREFNDYTKN